MTQPPVHRPSWQHDECPSWCITHHDEDDLPEDRFHDSVSIYLPAVIPDLSSPTKPAVATELMIVTSRRYGTSEDWVFIGQPDVVRNGLTLSPESARRLTAELTIHLDGGGGLRE